jgi:hypothetical protein
LSVEATAQPHAAHGIIARVPARTRASFAGKCESGCFGAPSVFPAFSPGFFFFAATSTMIGIKTGASAVPPATPSGRTAVMEGRADDPEA